MADKKDEPARIPIPDWWRVELKQKLDANRGMAKRISEALDVDPSTITSLHNGKAKTSEHVIEVSRLAGIRSPVVPALDPERVEAQEILSRLPADVIPSILSLMRHHDDEARRELMDRVGWVDQKKS